MHRLAFIRLHAGTYLPEVLAALDPLVDGFLFQVNKAPPALCDIARQHPKCLGVREWLQTWNNHRTLLAGYQWAEELGAKILLTFDEDEIVPVQLGQVMDVWEHKTTAPSITCKCAWTYGDLNTILADVLAPFGWHCKVARVTPGMHKAGMKAMNFPVACMSAPALPCPWPYRHTPITTETERATRAQRHDRAQWWQRNDLRTMSYDADMTYAKWISQARVLVSAPPSGKAPHAR